MRASLFTGYSDCGSQITQLHQPSEAHLEIFSEAGRKTLELGLVIARWLLPTTSIWIWVSCPVRCPTPTPFSPRGPAALLSPGDSRWPWDLTDDIYTALRLKHFTASWCVFLPPWLQKWLNHDKNNVKPFSSKVIKFQVILNHMAWVKIKSMDPQNPVCLWSS